MAKYDALRSFLRRWTSKHATGIVELRFADVERIIGSLLPNGANEPDWWRNEHSRARGFVQCQAWGEAGFKAKLLKGERVRFERLDVTHGAAPRSTEQPSA